jgi:nitrate reductase gamma subunit
MDIIAQAAIGSSGGPGLPLSLYWWGLNVIFPLGIILFVFGTVYRITRFFIARRAPVAGVAGFSSQFKEGIESIPVPFLRAARKDPLTIVRTIMFHVFILGIIIVVGIHIIAWNYIFSSIFGVPNILGFLFPISTTEHFTSAYQMGILGSNSYSSGGVMNPVGAWNSAMLSTNIFSPWGILALLVNGVTMSILALGGLIGYIVTKIIDDVTKHKFLSSIGDYIFLFLLLGIIITGIGAQYAWYFPYLFDTNQANWYGLHIALVGAFIGYLPFSKGFHMFWYYVGKGFRGYSYGRRKKA